MAVVLSVPAKAQPGAYVSIQTFYDELSPYGEWINDPNYGYVWRPDVDGDFRPYYTDGYWAMTEYGNTWISDYDWGWAPFHYGRWTYDDYYGWIWIPDTEWGPAWVTWRDGGGYYGWAPMGPRISLSVSFGPNYYVPNDWWVFIPCNYMYERNFRSYYRGPRYNTTIINRTTIINNTYNHRYAFGPRADQFRQRTGRNVNTYRITNINRPERTQLRGSTINMYRPQVAQARPTMRPSNVVRPERAIEAPGRASITQRPAIQSHPRDINRNDVRMNGNNNMGNTVPAQQARPQDRFDRQREMQQQQPSQQQAIENSRQQQWERQREQQAEQQRGRQQQAEQARQQQQMQQQQARQQQQMQQQQARQQQQMQQQARQQQMEQSRQQQQMQQQARQQQMEQSRQQQQMQQQARQQQMEQSRQQQQMQQQPQMQQRQQIQQQRQMERPQQAPQPQRMEQRGGGERGGEQRGRGR